MEKCTLGVLVPMDLCWTLHAKAYERPPMQTAGWYTHKMQVFVDSARRQTCVLLLMLRHAEPDAQYEREVPDKTFFLEG